jgi:hypothetical protein
MFFVNINETKQGPETNFDGIIICLLENRDTVALKLTENWR